MVTDDFDLTALATAGAAYLAIFSSTIVFSSKDAFLARLSAVVALFAIHWQMFPQLCNLLPNAGLSDSLNMIAAVGSFSASEMILISRVASEDLTAKGERGQDIGVGTLLYRAVCLYFNLRRVGTKWEVRDLSYPKPQSRLRFVAYKICTVGLALLSMDLATPQEPPDPEVVSEKNETLWRFDRLSVEDIITRLIVVIVFWIFTYIANYVINNTGAVLSVGLGLTKPERWPRMNNAPFSSLTSVRGLWGVFWHQQLRAGLTGWADAISDNILCLRRGTLRSRYTRLFLAFLISGILHHLHDIIWGVPHMYLSSIGFFSMQGLGIMFEDAVQAVTRSWGIPQRLRSVIGFFWLVAFLWWTTPRWFYPSQRTGEDGGFLPFPLIRQFLF